MAGVLAACSGGDSAGAGGQDPDQTFTGAVDFGSRDANTVLGAGVTVAAIEEIERTTLLDHPRTFDEWAFPGQRVGQDGRFATDARQPIRRQLLDLDRCGLADGVAIKLPQDVVLAA